VDIDAILGTEDSGDLADAIADLYDAIESYAADRELSALSPAVRTLYLVLVADSAMNNDGPQELIARGVEVAAVDALKEIGAAQLAAILAQAVAAPASTAALDEWAMGASDLEVGIVDWVDQHADELRAL
jgi:hypothetical protein